MRRILFSTAALLAVASAAPAQAPVAPVAPGWSALSGCWAPVAADGSRNVAANTPRVCVVVNGPNAADLLTVINDSITDRTHIDADGRQHEVSKQGCAGWERAEFSSDGLRLFLRSEQSCSGGLKRETTGLFALASNGDWVSVVNAAADSANDVRVVRYAPTPVPATAPAEIRSALQNRELNDRTARLAAQRTVSVNAVIEASRFLAPAAQEAWLAELEQDFGLDEKTLIRLADAGVAPSVIDVMVAVSNPKVFAVHSTGAVSRIEEHVTADRRGAPYCYAPVMDPWAWYAYDPCDPYLRYAFYRSRAYGYRYSPYYGYGYDYGRYGNPYYGGTVVIVRDGDAPDPGGRMTKDGFKSNAGSSSRPATKSSSGSTSAGREASRSSGDSGAAGSSTSSSSGSSSASGSSSSGGSSGSSGRTATRKPPA